MKRVQFTTFLCYKLNIYKVYQNNGLSVVTRGWFYHSHTFRYAGGNSEKIIGRYILDRGIRDKVTLIKFVQISCFYVYMWCGCLHEVYTLRKWSGSCLHYKECYRVTYNFAFIQYMIHNFLQSISSLYTFLHLEIFYIPMNVFPLTCSIVCNKKISNTTIT